MALKTVWPGGFVNVPSAGSGSGDVTASGTLANDAIALGGGSKTVKTTTTGTGVVTALAVNVGSDGAFMVQGGELRSLKLPASLDDNTYAGIWQEGVAAQTMGAFTLCYRNSSGKWAKADATDVATSGLVILGICVLAAANADDPTVMLLNGIIRSDAIFPAMTDGVAIYISESVGEITETAPANTDAVIRIIGFSEGSKTLRFDPSQDHMVHV